MLGLGIIIGLLAAVGTGQGWLAFLFGLLSPFALILAMTVLFYIFVFFDWCLSED